MVPDAGSVVVSVEPGVGSPVDAGSPVGPAYAINEPTPVVVVMIHMVSRAIKVVLAHFFKPLKLFTTFTMISSDSSNLIAESHAVYYMSHSNIIPTKDLVGVYDLRSTFLRVSHKPV